MGNNSKRLPFPHYIIRSYDMNYSSLIVDHPHVNSTRYYSWISQVKFIVFSDNSDGSLSNSIFLGILDVYGYHFFVLIFL